METIGYGFLLGIGIVLACLVYLAIGGGIFLFSMLISYQKAKRRNNDKVAEASKYEEHI